MTATIATWLATGRRRRSGLPREHDPRGGYRTVIAAYLHDPDLQETRAAGWPIRSQLWDNHEFSWRGGSPLQKFKGRTRPAQTRKVAGKRRSSSTSRRAWHGRRQASIAALRSAASRWVRTINACTTTASQGIQTTWPPIASLGAIARCAGTPHRAHNNDQRRYSQKRPQRNGRGGGVSSSDFPRWSATGRLEIRMRARIRWRTPTATIASADGTVEIANFCKGTGLPKPSGAEQRAGSSVG